MAFQFRLVHLFHNKSMAPISAHHSASMLLLAMHWYCEANITLSLRKSIPIKPWKGTYPSPETLQGLQ
uniref:Uncharacterized protein n=1 Tax=Nelumbo nucifera TaxID=4432 RepID=A0A822YXI1_NELNU|nr:TPA_asm: hypothetical protein HUJ06_006872 [Nelumbo nucifera]